jgi:hypothetical protein
LLHLRSLEDGFLGSWHPGKIVLYVRKKSYVKYDNILNDESNYLVEVVNVSSVLMMCILHLVQNVAINVF